jgi:serine/threonine-protein kinase
MGVVYRATHAETGQAVAIKVLPAELARDGGFADRFAREIASLQKLNHPNIVKLIEPGEDQGFQYYVMEFVQGRPLDKVIAAERRIPWQRAVELAIQICHGLKHAHDHGIIHRDLKPANLLITDDDTVKLTDFGIAKVFAGTAITATGGIIGTPEYMSPEQGDSRPITRRSDLYSLGVVLYAMLTGRAPFLGRSMAELLNLHRYGQFDRPTAIVPEIPSWLDELVCQLLEKDPEKRPPDAHVVARRLEVVQKKVALRSAQTLVEEDVTIASEGAPPKRRRGTGPATLMQRLMRAQLKELDEPGWLGTILQKTWVLVVLLLLSVGALTVFAMSSGEGRRWNAIHKLADSGDDRDLGLLLDRLQDYLRRYENGPHADEARAMIPDVERERRRRQFVRSPLVDEMRPNPDPPSDLERLYRKALLQLWLQDEDAARATFQLVIDSRDAAGPDIYIIGLAEEDIMSLDLQRAERLRAASDLAGARAIWERIDRDASKSRRHERWARKAREALNQFPDQPDSTRESADPPDRSESR